ncbi:M20/M25/M40 family metallo-hydrolase [Chitinophaga niabensis]|uniref:Carboxypeptidase Q n=1 Tax=Chitinophaga niabensis TaxID=536979 RepID=A0A1N6K1L5_9BACT|nr:M20/M25/M40 family metallo-hydrolase [Chitinophaga niabensis]SIO50429.1 PA domain-containing protein [Chitinophaga niabensis]
MKKPILALIACCIAQLSWAQQEDSLTIRRFADEVLTNGTAYENLRVLTKTIGGRLAGSPQMVKAEKWGEAALKAAGADNVYFQECKVPHWVRGEKEQARIISMRRDFVPPLNILALGNSVGTGTKGVTAPVIEVRSFEELEQKKDQVKGKIVFYNYPFNKKFIKTFYAYGDAVRFRGQGPSRASKYGALAVIVRSMSHSTDNNPHTGSTRYNDSFPKIAAVAIGLKDAEVLSKRIANDPGMKVFLRTTCQMLPDTIGHNVIGELRGSEFPNEYITVGGHLDSWDVCEGAHDDGTGCVQSIEILRSFKATGIRPKRTIRVVLFANEENGLRGGAKYAEEAKAKNEKHIFALESDAGGFTPRGFTTSMEPDKLRKVQGWSGLFLPYGIYDFSEPGGGADITPIHNQLGTPMAELSPDSQRYFDIHHAVSDNFEAVNKRELDLGAIGMGALVYLIDKYGL